MSSQIANSGKDLEPLEEVVQAMKRDWNERARENSKWYINTVRLDQSEEEFDATGLNEINTLILPELTLMTEGRAPRDLRFLEIGCGIGRMTKHLAGIFGEVHSTDVSGEMIRQARQRLSGLANVHLHETSGVDLAALPDDYFDIAFSAYVFQHVPSKEAIASNIREAYRVVKPGGIVRAHTNGVEAKSYAEVRKNTWAGATFTETEIRQLARELGAQLISIYGANTMFCWMMMRKPETIASPAKAHEEGTKKGFGEQYQIEYHARADDPAIRTIPTGGDGAWLALVVSGLDRELVEANTLRVGLRQRLLVPRYVGRVRPHFETVVAHEVRVPLEQLIYIEVAIPAGTPSGRALVKVIGPSGEATPIYEIELMDARPIAPKIVTVRNGADYQTDIYVSGPKSLLRLFVEGLNESATIENVKVKVGEHVISPTFVGFVTGIAGYQVDAQLPEGIEPGATTLELILNGVTSEAVAIVIKSISD